MSKADDVFWRQFGVILILLTVFGFAMYFVANSIAGDAFAKMYSDPEAVAARIAPAGQSRVGDPAAQTRAPEQTAAVAVAATSETALQPAAREESSESAATSAATTAATTTATTTAAAASAGGGAVDLAAGEKVYQSACFACHLTGVAEAPKIDDPAAWEPRLAQGMAGLLQAVTAGKGAMPPKGGFAHLTEEDMRNAIEYMLDKAGVSADG